jgi:hypothetical protein
MIPRLMSALPWAVQHAAMNTGKFLIADDTPHNYFPVVEAFCFSCGWMLLAR